MSLFVGRDEELVLLANQVVGASSSRAIVEGESGVGKTTFVNRLKTELTQHKVLTHADEEGAFWRRIGRLIAGEDSIAVGFTAAVVGVQRERVRIPPEVELSLFDELTRALAYLSKQGTRRVLIHVDNMEDLTREDAEKAAGPSEPSRGRGAVSAPL